MFWLRLMVAVLVLAAIAIAAIPLAVIIDLSSGGTGYGLCPDGLSNCALGYGRAIEVSMYLALGLFVCVALVRIAAKLHERVQDLSVQR